MTIFGENSLFSNLNTPAGATFAAILAILLTSLLIIVKITNLPVVVIFRNFVKGVMKLASKIIGKQEKTYHRDIEIGKLDEKRKTVKLYNFLNDLIIDLNLLKTGITPFELLWTVIIAVCIVTAFVCKLLFDNIFLTIIVAPIAIVGTFCIMYNKANIAHDTRIENVIEAENIICNNIKIGVVAAVRDSLDTLPRNVRINFKDFLDDVEQRNMHIRSALLNLNMKLGGIADDFIKKCIVFEMEEEHGIAGMFGDIVEINNIRMEMRIEMKRRFEEVKSQFIMGATMIFLFLFGVIGIYPNVREFYFTHWIGQIILIVDILILIIEFMYITYLRAQEL